IRRVDPSAADRVRESALAEFLSLGRLVDGCLLEGVDLVPAAHALTYDGQTLKVRRYWSPIFSYESDRLDLETNARRLAGAIGEAVRESVCGWGKAGLLLSGGLDSRLVLPFLDGRKTTCYTVCDRRNLETRVAEWAAKRVGAVHVKLWRGASHYIDMVPDASRVCEGSSEYFHAQLEGLWDRFGRDEDRVLLSGYAMNSLLRSYFMPYLGALQGTRTDHNETFRSVQSVRSFEEKILKILVPSGDAQAVVAPGLRQDVRAYTLEAVKRFAARHVDFIASPLDLFELYVFHHIALGRTHPFLESLRQRLPERCPVFDERLVAIALSTPPEQRFDSRVFRQALMLTDPRLALLIDANTCVPAVVGGNAAVRGKKALRFVERVPNAVRKRLPRSGTLWLQKASSWHDLGALWRWSDLWKRLDDLLADEAAMRDELLSADGVRELLRRHLDGKGYHQSIFSRVLSFLEWRRSCP
ncbi:MAG: asparagine synthase-related protein, partial [Actinomycetota bacterium]|nr:asparagine synthase-related protein [Actinomycetota bacterium]